MAGWYLSACSATVGSSWSGAGAERGRLAPARTAHCQAFAECGKRARAGAPATLVTLCSPLIKDLADMPVATTVALSAAAVAGLAVIVWPVASWLQVATLEQPQYTTQAVVNSKRRCGICPCCWPRGLASLRARARSRAAPPLLPTGTHRPDLPAGASWTAVRPWRCGATNPTSSQRSPWTNRCCARLLRRASGRYNRPTPARALLQLGARRRRQPRRPTHGLHPTPRTAGCTGPALDRVAGGRHPAEPGGALPQRRARRSLASSLAATRRRAGARRRSA